MSRNAKPGVGILLITGFIYGVFLLINFGPGGTLESLHVFGLIFIISLTTIGFAKIYKAEPFPWLGKFNKNDLKWVAFGIVGILFSVVGISYAIRDVIGIFLALGAGGIILAVVLYKTKSFIANMIVHGAYNSIAVLASKGLFTFLGLSAIPLSASPVFVPSFNFEGINPNDIASQVFMQFFVVALSEELLKIALSFAIAIFFTKNKYVVFGSAVVLWVVMHAILSYKI